MNPSLFQTLLKTLPDGVLIIGTNNEILFYNERFIEMWKVPPEMMERDDDRELLTYATGQLMDPETFLEEMERLYERDGQDTLRFLDGRIFIRRVKAWLDIEDRAIGWVLVFTDISKIIELDKISCTDFLTGMSNRRLFDRQIKELFLDFKNDGTNTIIVFLDLDGFKVLNDTCGHEMGDRLLVLLSKTFRLCLKDSAHDSNQAKVFRYGGDEFYILFPAGTKEKVKVIMEGIGDQFFTNQIKHLELDHVVDFSGGCVSFLPEDSSSHTSLLRVDALLYEAKRKGKGEILYSADL